MMTMTTTPLFDTPPIVCLKCLGCDHHVWIWLEVNVISGRDVVDMGGFKEMECEMAHEPQGYAPQPSLRGSRAFVPGE